MTTAVALTNIILGLAYTGYGIMTALEMRRDYKSFGFSHFGLAWLCMAFTCGPHHLFHGIHVGFEGRDGGGLDLLAVVVGLPVGVMWLALRVEAFAGGRGDRFIAGTPFLLKVAPVAAAAYFIAIVSAATFTLRDNLNLSLRADGFVVVNGLLLVIYMAIGWFVLRTQLTNRPSLGGWSVSGLCLAAIFPTCALMHTIFGVYTATGQYHHDLHSMAIDAFSVPAGLYFLWVVRSLYRDALEDWNAGPSEVVSGAPLTVAAPAPAVESPLRTSA